MIVLAPKDMSKGPGVYAYVRYSRTHDAVLCENGARLVGDQATDFGNFKWKPSSNYPIIGIVGTEDGVIVVTRDTQTHLARWKKGK